MKIVIALGGNALLKRGEVMSADNQRANVKPAVVEERAEAIACQPRACKVCAAA